MVLIPIRATEEFVDIKKGGMVTYTTDITSEPGIILLENPNGDYGVVIVNQVHPGGPVKVMVRPVGTPPVKKYNIGEVIAQLATF